MVGVSALLCSAWCAVRAAAITGPHPRARHCPQPTPTRLLPPLLSSPAQQQVLNDDYLARILLVIHTNLELARHPRHQAQALEPLQAGG